MEILCLQSAQTLEVVSRSHESVVVGYPVLWVVLRSQYRYNQENFQVLWKLLRLQRIILSYQIN